MTWLRRNALCLSVLMITVVTQATDVCESLCSCLDIDSDLVIVSCKDYKNHHHDKSTWSATFDLFEWPKTENRKIQALFNNMSIYLLPKISGDSKVTSINFDDNLIRTLPSNPFEYFSNLKSISLANNLITDLTKDFLKSPTSLKTLSLANSSLLSIDPSVVSHLKELREINLNLNEFTKLSAELLEALSSVHIIRIENNKLYTIDNAFNQVDYKFQQLFMGNNQFTIITTAMFEKFINLETIDLSYNKIKNIDENAFAPLESLKLLDLSNNFIRRVNIRLPSALEILSMANNELITWPLANTPDSLTELALENNQLEFIFPKDREVNGLRILDVSYNMLDKLPNTQFFKLDTLDLSYNSLTSVPQNLNTMAPLLRELTLDGNRISSVYFTERTTLGRISLSRMSTLARLDAHAFSNLAGIKVREDGNGTCVDVHVTHIENLTEIDEDAFEGVDLCFLDLSYNQLVTIPRHLTDWSKVQDGVDLQGNPLSCKCEDQWMIEEILNRLYYNEDHQYYLKELKCQSPEELQDFRFIQFFRHSNPFCGGFSANTETLILESSFGGVSFGSKPDDGNTFQIELSQGPGFIIIIVMCALILTAMILVGVRWQREQDRKLAARNRLYGYDY